LDERPRRRQQIDLEARQLDRQIGLRLARRRALIVVGAQALAHEQQKAAQDAVFVEIGNVVEALLDRRDDAFDVRDVTRPAIPRLRRRVELPLEQRDEKPGYGGMGRQRVFHIRLAEGAACLAQDLGIETQDDDLVPRQPGGEDEAVEAVIFHLAGRYAAQRVFEARPDSGDGEI